MFDHYFTRLHLEVNCYFCLMLTSDRSFLWWYRLAVVKHSLLILSIITFILYVFQPFGTAEDNSIAHEFLFLAGYGIIGGLSYGLLFFWLRPERLWQKPKTSLYAEGALLLLYLLLTSSLSYVYFTYWLQPGTLSFLNWYYFLNFVIPVALLPLAYIYYDRYKLYQQFLRKKTTSSPIQKSKQEKIRLQGNNRTDNIFLAADSLLYLQAQENYVQVVWQEEEATEQTLLRASLGQLEDQLREFDIVRVHRSFLANLNKVQKVNKRSAGLMLQFTPETKTVPVSRKYAEAVTAWVQENRPSIRP